MRGLKKFVKHLQYNPSTKWVRLETDGSWDDLGYFWDADLGPFSMALIYLRKLWRLEFVPASGEASKIWHVGSYKTLKEGKAVAKKACMSVFTKIVYSLKG